MMTTFAAVLVIAYFVSVYLLLTKVDKVTIKRISNRDRLANKIMAKYGRLGPKLSRRVNKRFRPVLISKEDNE